MTGRGSGSKKTTRDPRIDWASGSEMAQGAQGQLAWAIEACKRVMRPVVRLALAFGIKHAHLEEVLRELLIDEARRAWLDKRSEPNISQLSVTTGLNRKAVTARVREPADALPHTEMSAAAKTLTLWLQVITHDSALQSLPIVAEGETLSFEAVARRATRGNVHHRTVIDELVRLSMAIERDGRIELNAAGFVPAADLKSMLAFLGDNSRDHLLAGVSNTLGAGPPFLERSVFAAGIPLAECERIHLLLRQRWSALHHELTQELTQAFEEADASASARMRIGVYAYYEDMGAEPPKLGADASSRKASKE